jgi:hypothetical protein
MSVRQAGVFLSPMKLGWKKFTGHPYYWSAKQSQHMEGQEERARKLERDGVISRSFQTRSQALKRAYPKARILKDLTAAIKPLLPTSSYMLEA